MKLPLAFGLAFLVALDPVRAHAQNVDAQTAPSAPETPPSPPAPTPPATLAQPAESPVAPTLAPPSSATGIVISTGAGEQPRPAPGGPQPSRATPTTTGGPGDPAAAAAGPGGFSLTTADGAWQLRLRAFVQADARFWIDDTQRPQIDTFLVRRARPILEGKLPHGISFALIPDFGGGQVVLQDAYLGVDVSEALRFRFGKFAPPFGLERLRPTSNLSFVEFGLPTLLTPNRDVGAMVHGDLFGRLVGYAAGVFNGVPDNGSGDLDSDSDKEFNGRAYLRPLEPLHTRAFGRLFVGVATTFGRTYGTPSNPNFATPTSAPAYKTPGQATDFSYLAATGTTAPDYSNTVVANGPHNRYGAYFFEVVGPFSLMGEYYLSDQEVGRAGFANAWVHNKAYQAQATFVLFGASASYDFVHVDTPLDLASGHFGALEVAARVGQLDIDSAAFPNYASPSASIQRATEITAGLNWYLSDNAKFVVNWDNTQFEGGAKTPAEVSAGHREAENIVFVRAQIVY